MSTLINHSGLSDPRLIGNGVARKINDMLTSASVRNQAKTVAYVQFVGNLDRTSPSLDKHNLLRKYGFEFSAAKAASGDRWITEFVREQAIRPDVMNRLLDQLGHGFKVATNEQSIKSE